MHWIRQAPVTSEMLVLCIALFVCCAFQASVDRLSLGEVQRDWGAVIERELVQVHDGIRSTEECQLRGPFDVWDGEWWRIPITAFHHRNLVHLLICGGLALYLGRFLEDEWGSLATIGFYLAAITITSMAELLVGNAPRGLSGVVCALFGAVIVMRSGNQKLSSAFPVELVVLGVGLLVLSALGNLAGRSPTPSVLQASGLIYGLCIASIFAAPAERSASFRAGIVLLHLCLTPGLMLVAHPEWMGRYHWYQASQARLPQLAETELEKAVSLESGLTGAWLSLSEIAEERSDLLQAWGRLLRGLKENPVSVPLMDSARKLWRHLDTHQRRLAEEQVFSLFGKRGNKWLRAIRSSTSVGANPDVEQIKSSSEVMDLTPFSLDQKVELSPLKLMNPVPLWLKPINIDSVEDASEGCAL